MSWAHSKIAGELAARAAEKSDDTFITELNAIEAGWDLDKLDRFEEHNFALHRAINRRSNSPQLRRVLQSCIVLLPQYYTEVTGLPEISKPDHERIIAAIAKRDPRGARKAAEVHVMHGAELLTGYMTNLGYWD